MNPTYIDIINFCTLLSIPQLIKFREKYRYDKNKEFLVASEVLKIRTKQTHNKICF